MNGQVEMAAAFARAGFAPGDVHMSDILAGRVKLKVLTITLSRWMNLKPWLPEMNLLNLPWCTRITKEFPESKSRKHWKAEKMW